MPANETAIELRKWLAATSTLNSMPTTNMYRARPSWDTGNR